MSKEDIFDENGIIPKSFVGMEAIDYLNTVIWNSEIRDFRVDRFQGGDLTIEGSFDLFYYHQIEITFVDVSFMSIASAFVDPEFELVTDRSNVRLPKGVVVEKNDCVFKICDPTRFYDCEHIVIADSIRAKSGLVHHARPEA